MSSVKAVSQLRIQHPELKAEDAAEIISAAIELCKTPALRKMWRNSHIKSSLKWWGGSVIACLWPLILAPALLGPDSEQSIWYPVAGLGIMVGTIELYRAFFPPAIDPKQHKDNPPESMPGANISSTGESIDYNLRTGSYFLAAVFSLILLLIIIAAVFVMNDNHANQNHGVIGWLVLFVFIGIAIVWAVWPRNKRFELTDQVFSVPLSALKDKTSHEMEKRVHVGLDKLSGFHHRREVDDNGAGTNKIVVTFLDNGQNNSIEICCNDGQGDSADFIALSDALELHTSRNPG